MKKTAGIFFLSGLVFLSGAAGIAAQTENDPIGQAIRLEKLEKRLLMMEQKLFSDKPITVAQPTTGEQAKPVMPEDVRNMLADFEGRMGQLEEEWRKLYGGVEEMTHSVEKLADKLELISKDLDLRLQDVEKSLREGKVVVTTAEKSAKGTKTAAKKEGKEEAKEAKKAEPEITVPESISSEDLYKQAYNYLTAADYARATAFFKEFLKRHGQHELADNAYYWLGEVFLVQDKPEQAVIEFSNGLAAFPDGGKAPANLLKMGVAFLKMDRKDHAKSAWSKLLRDFPNTPESKKARQQLDELG